MKKVLVSREVAAIDAACILVSVFMFYFISIGVFPLANSVTGLNF